MTHIFGKKLKELRKAKSLSIQLTQNMGPPLTEQQ